MANRTTLLVLVIGTAVIGFGERQTQQNKQRVERVVIEAIPRAETEGTGWPRAVARPRLPQTNRAQLPTPFRLAAEVRVDDLCTSVRHTGQVKHRPVNGSFDGNRPLALPVP